MQECWKVSNLWSTVWCKYPSNVQNRKWRFAWNKFLFIALVGNWNLDCFCFLRTQSGLEVYTKKKLGKWCFFCSPFFIQCISVFLWIFIVIFCRHFLLKLYHNLVGCFESSSSKFSRMGICSAPATADGYFLSSKLVWSIVHPPR